ncbi:unnamed protein product [Protopolystoma xenopodis]|uniref:Uncharacterized protein n=1 Tax=Protopolystoma xenopodis TaxID=117903 RepID=A0A448WK45_9PLAT|nr:unnamed protein product [Protopolystoma xenopodis]
MLAVVLFLEQKPLSHSRPSVSHITIGPLIHRPTVRAPLGSCWESEAKSKLGGSLEEHGLSELMANALELPKTPYEPGS